MKISPNTFVSISFVDDKEIQNLNKEFRDKNNSTDVLSFNIDEENEEGEYYLGDIVVNVEQAERQAKDYGNTTEEEISELVAHGMMHLMGVHHEGDDH